MVFKLEALLTFYILTFINCQLYKSISPSLNEDSKFIKSRNLQFLVQGNCEKFDKSNQNNLFCLKCKDKLLLPDCSKCPIGYKIVNNKCVQCGDNQLFCGSSNPNDYCYKGFDKIGDQCICQQGKSKVQNYCLKDDEVAYSESYIGNKILVQFSSQIQLSQSLTNPDKPNKDNCISALSNYQTGYSQKVLCYLSSDNPDQFYITLDANALQSGLNEQVPIIASNAIHLKSDYSKQITLIQQPTFLQVEQPKAYYGLNDFTPLLSSFKQSIYYIDVKSAVNGYYVPKEDFIDQNSKQIFPQFQQGLTSNEITLQQLFSQAFYPQDSVTIPAYIAQEPNLSISLTFICSYPYNQFYSNIVTFKTVQSQNSFSQVNLKNQAPYFNDEITPIIINCGINNSNLSQDDEFSVQISIINKNNDVEKYVEKVKYQKFPYTFNIPSYLMKFDPQVNPYTIKVEPSLNGVAVTASQTQLTVSRKPLNVQIMEGNRENVDPRNIIQLKGQATNPAFQDSKPGDFTYTWSCYDEVLKYDCKDELQNSLVLQNLQSIQLKANTFDFNGIYTITLVCEDTTNNEQNQSKITIKTITGQLQIIYDPSYDTNTILPDQLLKFELEYNGDDKLKNSFLIHSFEIGYENQSTLSLTQQSTPQRENFIFTKLIDSLSDQYLTSSLNFFIRFFVQDQNQKFVGATRRINFKTNPPPYDCELVFEKPITGSEVAFVDKVKIKANNCKSSVNDGKLLYQFLYYNEQQFQNKEKQFPDILYRKYLTKFQENDSIETFLPPGQIVFIVVVKDSKETKVKYSSSITIKQNTFDQTNYENFLSSQNSDATNFQKTSQYEKQVCVYGMMIDCIENFENINKSLAVSQKVSELKDSLKKQFLNLPTLIPNDLLSQSLQEFTIRCLKRLYSTANGPDSSNQITRLSEVSDLVKQRIDLMNSLNPFIPEVRDTYRKKMLITLDITSQTIEQLSSTTMSTPSTSWSDLQIKDVSQNLQSLALTLYVNQQSITWDTKVVSVQVQKVDQFNLFKNYLDYDMTKFGDSNIDSNQIYNVEIQQWKDNIYSFEQSYKDMVEPSISKTSDPQIISYLKQTYPAVYPKFTKSKESKRFLRFLKEEEEYLELPANVNTEFKEIQGNKKVKCTQRIKDVWTKSSCKTKVTKTGETFTVTCSCATPSFTSIVADVEALFENNNFNKIFSLDGINTIFSVDNWHQYSAVYVLIGVNIAVIASFFIGNKLDKADASIYGQQSQAIIVNELVVEKKEDEIINIKNTSEQTNTNQIVKNNKQLAKKSQTQEDSPEIDGSPENDIKNNSIIDIKDIDFQITRSPTKATTIEINKDYIKNASKSVFEKKFTFEHPQQWKQSQQPSLKLIGESNVEVPYPTEQQSQKDVLDVCTMYRINFVESKDRDQHFYQVDDYIRKCSAFDVDAATVFKTQDKKPELSKKEIEKIKQQDKENLKKQQEADIQKKSLEYLIELSMIKGTCIFHDLLQIFIIYDKDETRLFRFSVFYNQIIWLLTLSATFGENLTIVQVIALSVISSISFGLLKALLKFTLNKKSIRMIGYIIIFCFLIFCYYAIAVVMGSQQPSEVNGWVINYTLAQGFDIFVSGVISSATKYYMTLKFLPKYHISHLVYKFTNADTLFGIFK